MKKIIILLIVAGICSKVTAQNTTYAPSSMFGIGELSTGEGGVYAGMGGTGIALRSEGFINAANPAALTELSNRHITFDVGVMGAYKTYTQSGIRNNSVVGNLNNLGIGFRILPRWYGAMVLSPISSTGYAITLENQIEGTGGSMISSLFKGEGGISKIGLSNAFLLTPKLSAGVNLSFVTGSITQSETQESIVIKEVSEKRALYADFGIQYKHKLGYDKFFTAGAVYGYSQRLSQDNTLSVQSSSGSSSIEESQRTTKQCLPQFLGIGVAYNSLKWVSTIDYKYLDWSGMESSTKVSFNNQHRLSAGVGYIPGNPYKSNVEIQAGAGISNSYVVIEGKKSNNYYLSTGAGFQLKNGTKLSLGVKYNNQYKTSTDMHKEKGISLFLNISFNERLYVSRLK